MTLATKNNALILKDGKVAENCNCCGGWYCYGCGEGFKYDSLSGFDCAAFGTVSINGVSSYVPYAINSQLGCFSIQNGLFWQTKSTQPLCEVWVTGPNNNVCVRRYVRKQYYLIKPVFGDTIIWDGIIFPIGDTALVQTTLDVKVSTEPVSTCDGAGRFAATEVAVRVSSELRAQLGFLNPSGGLSESSPVNFFGGYFADNMFLLLRQFELRVLTADKNNWPIMFDAVTLTGVAGVTTLESIYRQDTPITDWTISKLPTSAPVVISPQLVDPACQ